MRFKVLGKEQASHLDFSKEIDFDKLEGEEYAGNLSEEQLAKVAGGEDDVFPCPCGGTYHLIFEYARSYCYRCDKCGKSLVGGCF